MSANLPRIAIFGATGGIGRATLEHALRTGHQVRVLARDPSALESHPRLTVIEGSATDLDAVAETIESVDAVVCALGAPAMSRSKVRSVGTETIIRAMKDQKIRRLISVSLLGARETRAHLPFFLRYFFFPLYLRRAAKDHDLQEEIIERSDLDWTVVRPPHLTDGPRTGKYAVGFANDEISEMSLDISRADVADFMLQQICARNYLRKTPAISYRAA